MPRRHCVGASPPPRLKLVEQIYQPDHDEQTRRDSSQVMASDGGLSTM